MWFIKELIALFVFCIVSGVVKSSESHDKGFRIIYKWSQLEFDYPSLYHRERDIQSGNFKPGKPAPIDTDVYYAKGGHNKIFVTIPRFQSGVPVTLGTITSKDFNGNPIISPYPAWNWHTNPERCNMERIVSVYRVAIDECDRLWVLDTGKLEDDLVCPPQVLIFDLHSASCNQSKSCKVKVPWEFVIHVSDWTELYFTIPMNVYDHLHSSKVSCKTLFYKVDRLIHRYEIPSSQIEGRSILVTPVIEVLDKNHKCLNTFAYLADCQTYSIIIYDFRRDTSWKVSDKTMYPHPEYGTFTIQGESFELMDGILGMSLSPNNGGNRILYYHAMSSPTEHWVYTSFLRNQSLFSVSTPPQIFNTFSGKRKTQVPAEAMDSNGIMYFGLVGDVQIACYNTRSGDYGNWNSSDIIGDNPETLQFASGVKVIKNKKGEEELWILTSRFQKVATGSLKSFEINFRIQAAKTYDLISHTQCMKKNQEDGGFFPHISHGGYPDNIPLQNMHPQHLYPQNNNPQTVHHTGGYGHIPANI